MATRIGHTRVASGAPSPLTGLAHPLVDARAAVVDIPLVKAASVATSRLEYKDSAVCKWLACGHSSPAAVEQRAALASAGVDVESANKSYLAALSNRNSELVSFPFHGAVSIDGPGLRQVVLSAVTPSVAIGGMEGVETSEGGVISEGAMSIEPYETRLTILVGQG